MHKQQTIHSCHANVHETALLALLSLASARSPLVYSSSRAPFHGFLEGRAGQEPLVLPSQARILWPAYLVLPPCTLHCLVVSLSCVEDSRVHTGPSEVQTLLGRGQPCETRGLGQSQILLRSVHPSTMQYYDKACKVHLRFETVYEVRSTSYRWTPGTRSIYEMGCKLSFLLLCNSYVRIKMLSPWA